MLVLVTLSYPPVSCLCFLFCFFNLYTSYPVLPPRRLAQLVAVVLFTCSCVLKPLCSPVSLLWFAWIWLHFHYILCYSLVLMFAYFFLFCSWLFFCNPVLTVSLFWFCMFGLYFIKSFCTCSACCLCLNHVYPCLFWLSCTRTHEGYLCTEPSSVEYSKTPTSYC